MNQEAKEARNAYMREWRARNKDKLKKISTRYWNNVHERAVNSEEKQY